MKVKALIFAAALLACASVFAQESNRDANGNIQYGPYETNKFFDNWFVGVGGGVNIAADDFNDLKTGMGLGVDVNLGKWIDPCFGFRAGWQGLNAEIKDYVEKYDFHYVHGDFLWNVSNQFWGYKENRFYNLVPYLTAGLIKTNGNDFAAGAGLLNKFRLGKRVDLTVDLRAIASEADDVYGAGGAIIHGAALAGLAFNLGKTNWTRKATTVAGYAAAVAAAEAAAAAALAAKNGAEGNAADLQNKVNALTKENQDLKDQLNDLNGKYNDALANAGAAPTTVYFQIGQAKLSDLEKAHLAAIANGILATGENTKFTVAGNADSKTGSAKRNMQLSQQRADYVADILVNKYGVAADRLSIVANGGNDIDANPALSRCVIVEKD